MSENIKYLHDGRAVIVRGQLKEDSSFVVSEVLEGIHGDESYVYPSEVMFTVKQVFDEAPTAVLNQAIVKLNAQIEDLRTAKQHIENEIRAMNADQTKRLAKFKRVAALKHIEEFIDGKITHYLFTQWGDLRIVPFGEAVSDEDRWNKVQKLLTLGGKTNGDLEWRLNQYSDGSGSNYTVLPCLSLEEARSEAQKIIDLQEVKDARQSIVKFAAEYNLTLPDWYIPTVMANKRKGAESTILDLQERLARAQKELE